ncbi:MAG: GNAT family N-acetyltransferase [Ruminococcaceae bacterium]|nr:GNAT family N-acetyltransferase [Oscillospiraceae bacterium]
MKYTQAGTDRIPQLVRMRIEYIQHDHVRLCSADERIMPTRQPHCPDYYVRHVRHLNKDLFAFTAEDNGTVVAASLLQVIEKPSSPIFFIGRAGEALNVFTMPEYRRQGISTALKKIIIAFARQYRVGFLELRDTEAAHPMHEKIGFAHHQLTPPPVRRLL